MFHGKKTFVFLIVTCCGCLLHGQDPGANIPKKVYTTVPLGTFSPPDIDGILEDSSWEAAEWGGNFTQREPIENAPPTEQTQFKIIYDDKNLYVAIRCFDAEPDNIVKRLSRRDGFEGDRVTIMFDSNLDLQTAFAFTITAAGVKGDEFVTQNGNAWDESWNPIWYVKTATDSKGWTAEMRIPFSQLRFGKNREQLWGLQLSRMYFRNNERSEWQFFPRNAPGWISETGKLLGLTGLKQQKQFEIQPYVVSSLETYEEEKGNPFMDGRDTKLNGGIDGKVGITNDLTLDFTANPDFGQVEADPSAIALDGFQIFFDEQRPFFVENKNIFDYRISNTIAGNTEGTDNLFYSRRIGRSPHGSPDTAAGEYAEQPENTTILGAAKFSGKTRNGWSIGVLESVTSREYAKISNNGERREQLIEPLTNYFVGRLQKDFNERNSFIGGIFTATNRGDLPDNLDFLHQSAYSGGLDFKHQWKNRTWYTAGNLIMSAVSGSKEAIRRTQEDIARLYQRVDATYTEVDTTRTSLAGHGGNVQFGKARGNLNFESGVTWRSPGLELNDVGFLRRADYITHYAWAGYKITKPFAVFRKAQINYNHWSSWDFGGDHNELTFNTNNNAQFKNNWYIGTSITARIKQYSNTALRGGPKLRLPDEVAYSAFVDSDERKKLRYGFEVAFTDGEDKAYRIDEYGIYFIYRPINAIKLSLEPSYKINKDKLQFVKNIQTGSGVRYLNAEIDQKTLSMSFRLNYTINPNLTIEYWGQPFISRGRYSDFKHVTNPQASNFEDRFYSFSDDEIRYDEESQTYFVDEGHTGATDYSFKDPDFSFVQFRSNLVLRWEYIPGSELYLVWSQGITQSGNPRDNLLAALDRNILGTQPRNIFLIKATYRFVL
ncbi:DUF5916 domain-containing protein [Sinomicrobium weinanense]|uniref:Carbohydrate binding family 9 domain-containing protein n=1 Tax=Sinomicrobium weinanense TaxID=2842200 RepID=A0A926JU79_9FLAO|nr:DUF5916 domain-containing protein [Sinomicrobium weinanense]MBC9797464.1 carbohydrate binding family 9 domain-containing protein [Sinomicrobium weinanense]MBU3124456.1 carbohydrate binding family 9 domain-containing protein [Sinomicrobium weinanense]